MKRMMQIVGMLLVLTSVVRAQVPSVTVKPVDTPPVIDGALSEPLWQRPADAKDFKVLNTGELAKEQTEVWLARDNAWLFVAFKCHEPAAGKIVCAVKSRDRGVHQDDSVEVFISPGTKGKTYWHFIVNAAGVQGDNRSEGEDHGIPWNGHWRSAARIDAGAGCWTAELAIPLFYLTDKAGAEPWTLNFTRSRRVEKLTFSAWSPVKGSFHSPAEFGKLEGLAGVKGEKMFAPVMGAVKVSGLIDIPRRYYVVSIEALNQGAVAGKVNGQAVDITKDGETKSPAVPQELGPSHKGEIKLEVDVEKIVVRNTRALLTLTDALGTWTASTEVDRRKESKPLMAAMDRTYYTQEKTGGVMVQVNLPATVLEKARLRVVLEANKKQTAEAKLTGPEMRVELPLRKIEPGSYPIRVELENAGGEIMASETCTLIKRAPAVAGTEVKLDRWNGATLINEKPFFPYGFIGVPRDSFPLLKRMGFNAVLQWMEKPLPEILKDFDAAQQAGLYLAEVLDRNIAKGIMRIMLEPGWLDALRSGIATNLPGFVDAIKTHPALLAWYGPDEPGWEVHKTGCRELWEAVNARDGYHPTFQLFCGFPPDIDDWLRYSEIDSVDIYTYDPKVYLSGIKSAVATTRYLQQPFWVVPLGETCSGSPYVLPPRLQRLQTYLSLIHGANGIFYFIWPVTHVDNFAVFKALASEIQTLTPALLTRAPVQTVRVAEGGDPDQVQAALRLGPGGEQILLAANMEDRPVTVSIGVSTFGRRTKVSNLFTGASYPLADGRFSDTMEGYGTRAYRLVSVKEPDVAPVEIGLILAAEPAPAAAAGGAAGTLANLLPNPGFETTNGWKLGTPLGPTNAARFEASGAHGGKQAVHFERTSDMPTLIAVSDWINLKPNTTYRFSAWARGEFTSLQTGLTMTLYSEKKKASLVMLGGMTDAEKCKTWEKLEKTFTTGPEPDRVQCYIYAGATFAGSAWADDVCLEEIGTADTTTCKNILPNSGFEYATVPKLPDHWSFGPWLPVTEENLTGKPKALITQDDKVVYEGKYSLRVRGMHQIYTAPSRSPFKMDWGKPHVFSVYMKADRDDVVVWMMINGGTNQWKQARVGKEWARYFCTGMAPEVQTPFVGLCLRTEGAAGLPLTKSGWLTGRAGCTEEKAATVWFDAAQLETGTEPTEYVRDIYTVSGER